MPDGPSIAITGAGGFVATNLRRSLGDFQLLSFSRSALRPLKNEKPIRTDYSSSELLASQLKSSDVLVHLIGIGESSSSSGFVDVNINLTSMVVRAAKSAKVKQIVFLSGLGVSPNNSVDYFVSKFHAEKIIRESGIAYTIFRPSFIIGENDHLTQLLNRQIRTGTICVPDDGKYVLEPISIHDVVAIIRDSFMNEKFLGKTMDLVGPTAMTLMGFVKLFCKNRRVRISPASMEDCMRDALTSQRPMYSIDDLILLSGNYFGNFENLREAYGRPIKSVEDFL